MRTVTSFNKQNGVTYVYEVLESEWDPTIKNSRNKRRCIGKIDPETGEVVPTGKRGRKKKAPVSSPETEAKADITDYKAQYESALKIIEQKDQQIQSLQAALAAQLSAESEFLHKTAQLFSERQKEVNSLLRKV